MSFAAPAQAQTTLVSNFESRATGQSQVVGDNLATNIFSQAQKFTTGSNTGGYTLNSAKFFVFVHDGAGAVGKVSIYSAAASGEPGTQLHVLTGTISGTGEMTFSAPANTILEAGTSYFLHFEDTSTTPPLHNYGIQTTSDNDTDSGLSGWTVGARYSKNGTAAWSLKSSHYLGIELTGSAVASNSPPEFSDATLTREIAENSVADVNVGAVIPEATDADVGATLTYSMEGVDEASFNFNVSTRQITTRSGVTYNFEATKNSYSVTIRADDGNGGTDTVDVTISLTDVEEPPDEPDEPTVSPTPGSTTSLDVSWTAPGNDGRPAEITYDLRYRVDGTPGWDDGPQNLTGTSTTITGLTANTTYDVQVRATNAEGDSTWSDTNERSTSSGTAFNPPVARVLDNWGLTPSSLNVGDRFRLLTVSSNRRDASASDIATYNTFVQNDVSSNGHADIQSYASNFRAIGCSETVDAIINTGTPTSNSSVSIHWLGGAKAADNYLDLYDGNWDSNSPKHPDGTDAPTTPATGRTSHGCISSGGIHNDHYLGGREATVGYPYTQSRELQSRISGSNSIDRRVYGLSQIFQVVANTPPTASNGSVTTDEDTAHTFEAGDFSFSDTDSGDTPSGVEVVTLPTAGTLTLDGTDVTPTQDVTKSDIDDDKLVFTPAANANGTGYASFTFKVSDGTEKSDSAYTMTVNVTAVNDAATGAPSISGTARVGETLTAAKGTIADDDGVTKADDGESGFAYTYQWVRVDSGTDSDISGATSSTYTLADADQGNTIKVEVSFTDDADNDEELTSTETATIEAASTNNAPEFPDATLTRGIAENSAANVNVGAVIPAATDADVGATLEYSMEGADEASFNFDVSTRQITTKSGVHYDFEAKTSYSVTIKVSDGTDSDTVAVTINLTDEADTGDTSLNPSAGDVAVARKSRATYSIQIQGSWNTGVTPGGVPSNSPHFTTFVGGIHNDQVTFLESGGSASAGVESMAELGTTGTLVSEVNAEKPDADRALTLAAPGITGSRTHNNIAFTSDHPRITLTSMVAPSPDWFVGVSGRSLLDSSGNWLPTLTVSLYPWDAGTENGAEFSLSNPATSPKGLIASIRGRGKFTGEHIAQLVFTRTGSVALAPAAPTTFAATPSDAEVTLGWDVPTEMGITGHEYRRKADGAYGAWTAIPDSAPSGANEDSFTVTGLTNDTNYTFQLRAVNSVGGGVGSAEVSAMPVAANAAPEFADATLTREIAENSGADVNVGAVIPEATDADVGATLEYSMEGTDAASFNFNATTRQITTRDSVTYDRETKDSYSVTIKVSDGTDSDTVAVTINLANVIELPSAPTGLTVSPTLGVGGSLDASWTAPTNTGEPAVIDYDLQYATSSSGPWSNGPQGVTGTSSAIPDLSATRTRYYVRVSARNVDGDSGWSGIDDDHTGTTTTTANCPAPNLTGRAQVWSATVSVGNGPVGRITYYGFNSVTGEGIEAFGALSDTSFQIGTNGYTVRTMANGTSNNAMFFTLDSFVTDSEKAELTLHVCNTALALSSATVVDSSGFKGYQWSYTGDDWRDYATRNVYLSVPSDNNAPTATDGSVTTDEDTAHAFEAGDFSFADTDSGDMLSGVEVVTLPLAGTLTLDGTDVTTTQDVTKSDIDDDKLVFTPAANANGTGYASFTFKVSDGTEKSALAYTMTVNVTAVNDPATGLPTISGTAQVGETLTAAKGTIADDDGVTKADDGESGFAYTYQWVRVDSGTDTDISSATSSTYTLADADQGNTIKVKVSFTDDAGTDEGPLTSTETETIEAASTNTPPTASNGSVTTTENTAYTFAAGDFNFADTDSGDALEKVKIVTLPQAGTLALSGTTVMTNQEVTKADIDADNLTFTPTTDASGSPYTTFTFKVNDGEAESVSTYTITVNVTTMMVMPPPLAGMALVSNIGQSSVATPFAMNTDKWAMSFTTGSNASGYGLTGIEISINSIADGYSAADFSAGIFADGTSDIETISVPRGSALFTLSGPATLNTGINSFSASNAILAADTTYWLILDDGGGSGAAVLDATFSNAEDSGQALAWSIGNNRLWASRTALLTANTSWGSSNQKFTFRVKGALIETGNNAPDFSDATLMREVAENSVADVNVGAVIPEATDADVGATLEYSMEGTDEASFNFDVDSRQITTRSGVTYDFEADPSYTVTIRVSDGTHSDTLDVTISLTDADEPPDAPAAPMVAATAGSTTSLDVSWTAPANAGKPEISSYDLQFRVGDMGDFTAVTDSVMGTSATIADLTADTEYQVQVSATNDEGTGTWSDSGTGSTSATVIVNTPPTATDGSVTTDEDTAYAFEAGDFNFSDTDSGDMLELVEVVTLPLAGMLTLDGTAVTTTQDVTKSDIDDDKLVFTPAANANGTGYASFTFKVSDGTDKSDSAYTMTVNVTAVNDAATGLPTISGTAQVGATLAAATTDIADADGLPASFSYQWVRVDGGTDADISGATSSTYTLVGDDEGNTVKVEVSFTDDAGNSEGPLTSAATGVVALPANTAPEFSDATLTLEVAENTVADTGIGDVIPAATDAEGNDLVYSMEGDDEASFAFDVSTRQISTKAALDYEDQDSYSVTIRVSDGTLSDTVGVTINVTDVDEPPDTPAAPTVTATPGSTTSLDVEWTAPDNAGKPAVTYFLQYRVGDSGNFRSAPDPTGTSATIAGLTANTDYEVQVMAENEEGKSDWSESGAGRTGNTAPAFSSDTATRNVAENAPADTDVGEPVEATDADNDTRTYTLGGADATSFAVDDSSGQITTIAGVNYDYEETASYTVTVTADDGNGATDTIEVTINLTNVDELPDAPAEPDVSATAGSATSLDVSWTAPANTGKPEITSYDLQYRVVGDAGWTAGPQDEPGTSATIDEGLTAHTGYQVQVHATNEEGDSDWSAAGEGTTGNTTPIFDVETATRSVAENTPADTGIGAALPAATDADGDALIYSLEGADAASFAFDAVTRQLSTLAALDHEAKDSYSVTIQADDDNGGTDTIEVTIAVTDVDEPPDAPAAPSVAATPGSTTSLDVDWTAPGNDGRPAITGYDVQYRVVGVQAWTAGPQDEPGTSATIAGVTPNSDYQVQVLARNNEGDSDWSESGTGNTGNTAPAFDVETATRSVAENTPADTDIGDAFPEATDTDLDTLIYSLEGADESSFAFDASTRQLSTLAALDFEAKDSYAVTVKADDSNGGSDTIAVTINLTNVDEPPDAPGAPSVAATPGSTTSLDVEWTAPGNDGRPEITGYDLQYRVGNSGPWTVGPQVETGTSASIAGLTPSTGYEVQVFASNDEGDSGWSEAGTGSTGTPVNSPPAFSNDTLTRSVAENTAPGAAIGAVIPAATDADLDTLAYSLEGTDAASFDFDETTRQLSTLAALDFETTASYAVTISVSDGNGGTDSVEVTIAVTNVDEPPTAPAAPGVSATSGSTTSLDVTWIAPGNDGKLEIASYDLQYRVVGDAGWTAGPQDVTGTTTAAIAGLTAHTDYQVQVHATNEEGDSDWSAAGEGTTGNTTPTFDVETATRSVAENTPADTAMGDAFPEATDADGDALTYSLEGTDAASFAFDAATRQLSTLAALDHETKDSYSVTIKVDDGNGGTDTVEVTVMVSNLEEQAAPPDNPQVSSGDGSDNSLAVTWRRPDSNGGPAITGYEVRYREGADGEWLFWPHQGTGTSTTITGLKAETPYQVQVRSLNGETQSDWSATMTGTTGASAEGLSQGWLTRFGRTASDNTLSAIESRWRGERIANEASHLTLGGQQLNSLFNWGGNDRTDGGRFPVAGPAGPASPDGFEDSAFSGAPAGAGLGRALPELRDVLLGSSFFYSAPAANAGGQQATPGQWALWGDVATTRFDGTDGALTLDGEVATGTVGADLHRGRWLGGVALSYSEGEGSYRRGGADEGALSTELASVNPFVRYEHDERTSVWGVLGYGTGEWALTPAGSGSGLSGDLTTKMAAVGGRGVLSKAMGGLELAIRSDVRATATMSESSTALMGDTGSTSRVRLLLEGTRSRALESGAVLGLTLEAGLRYDGGDAETGGGVEVGGALSYASGRLAVQANARVLATHEDEAYEEWGAGGSVLYRPRSDGSGLSVRLGSAWGVTESGVQSLWTRQDARGLARGGMAMDAAQRFETELGYGIAGRRRTDVLWYPYFGAQGAGAGMQTLRLGLKLNSESRFEAGLEFGRRLALPGDKPENALMLQGSMRW